MADESCARPVIRALRAAGHDVIAIAEISKGTPDERVMERAFRERRVLITEDNDFGELVYVRRRPSAGVVLVKFHGRARSAKPAAVVEAVAKLANGSATASRSSNPDECDSPSGHQPDPQFPYHRLVGQHAL